MRIGRGIALVATTIGLVVATGGPVSAHGAAGGPVVSALVKFGDLGSGSTVGPDGALYVTDGNAGSVLRINPRTGRVRTFATGLPKQVLGIGGAIDVEFVGRTAYVLVTMVGGDLLLPSGTVHVGDDVVGIYRLERDGTFTVVADIGAWAAAHPPAGDFFITTGVQYAFQPYHGGFLVTDGHHNRVLRVTLDGQVSEVIAFDDIVPTGIDVANHHVYVAEAGPVPHRPEDAKVVELRARSGAATEVASGDPADGAGLTVDVKQGPGGDLYALLQGVWDLGPDPANAGSPASANSGMLVRIERGTFTPVAEHLNRPTSMEFIGDTAYVVSLAGTVTRIDHVSHSDHGHR